VRSSLKKPRKSRAGAEAGGGAGAETAAAGRGRGRGPTRAQRDLKLLENQTENKCPNPRMRGFDVFAVPQFPRIGRGS